MTYRVPTMKRVPLPEKAYLTLFFQRWRTMLAA